MFCFFYVGKFGKIIKFVVGGVVIVGFVVVVGLCVVGRLFGIGVIVNIGELLIVKLVGIVGIEIVFNVMNFVVKSILIFRFG